MKFPQSPRQLKEEVYLSIDKNYTAGSLHYKQMLKMLRQVEDTFLMKGIVQVFEDSSRGKRNFLDQDFAGKLLYALKPDTDISLPIILHRTLYKYNLSVEELSLYLAENMI